MVVAVFGERHALDQFHDEKRPAPLRVVPASSSLAMCGWSISASACRSASNRARSTSRSIPALISLTATRRLTGSRLLGHPDAAHAPFADLLEQLVAAGDHRSDLGWR